MNRKLFSGLATGLFLVGMSGASHATILTFDGLAGYNYVPISQSYGDNVTALTDVVGSYGRGNGFTPNITVSYNTTPNATGEAWLEAWDD